MVSAVVTATSIGNDRRMQDLADLHLDKMSVKELEQLKLEVHSAIRAAIRQRAALKSNVVAPAVKAPVAVDLERERDAWMAARQKAPHR